MAKQGSTYGVKTTDAWAFGPAMEPAGSEPVLVEGQLAPAPRSDYGQPAVFLAGPTEPTPAQRGVWDELPPERARRNRRYVGKHRP
jgi:hypothetical protein